MQIVLEQRGGQPVGRQLELCAAPSPTPEVELRGSNGERRRHVRVPEAAARADRRRVVRPQPDVPADLPAAADVRHCPAHARRRGAAQQGQCESLFESFSFNSSAFNSHRREHFAKVPRATLTKVFHLTFK